MGLTAERWEQIKDVLHRAMQVSPGRRAAFLDQACGGGSSMRREVESLLAADEQARSSFLQSPPSLRLARRTRLGDYEIQSLLGVLGLYPQKCVTVGDLGQDMMFPTLDFARLVGTCPPPQQLRGRVTRD